MGHPRHLHLHQLHASVLPFGQQPRPSFGQPAGMADSQRDGDAHRFALVGQRMGHHQHLSQRLLDFPAWHDNPLAARRLEASLSTGLCLPTPSRHEYRLHTGRFRHLSVRQRRDATVHLLPILRGCQKLTHMFLLQARIFPPRGTAIFVNINIETRK